MLDFSKALPVHSARTEVTRSRSRSTDPDVTKRRRFDGRQAGHLLFRNEVIGLLLAQVQVQETLDGCCFRQMTELRVVLRRQLMLLSNFFKKATPSSRFKSHFQLLCYVP